MPVPQIQNDSIALRFINPLTMAPVGDINMSFTAPAGLPPPGQNLGLGFGVPQGNAIENATSINMEKDFFTPSNGLTFVIEDDRVPQFYQFLQRGYQVEVDINGKPNMIGYIFDYHLTYTKGGGTRMSIQCKDLLEYMAQGTVFPNLGTTSVTNVHFTAKQTLGEVLQTIANSFYFVTNSGGTTQTNNPIQIVTDDSGSTTLGMGYNSGLRTSTGKNQPAPPTVKSLSTALEHLSTPAPGESYLAYMLRHAKLAGASLKMSNENNYTIICKSPTYDRSNSSPFSLIRSITNPQGNNIISGSIHYSLDNQPSVVIMEANTTGDGRFYLSTAKGVAINALTAYIEDYEDGVDAGTVLIPSVAFALGRLTSQQLGAGYHEMPFNQQLYDQSSNIPIAAFQPFSSPYYTVSPNAHTAEEAKFAAAEYLADCQDRYVELVYEVQGWTMTGTTYVWQPDMMVTVLDDTLFPIETAPGSLSSKPFPMWIRKVNFMKSRNGGTTTILHLTLPYTHQVITTE